MGQDMGLDKNRAFTRVDACSQVQGSGFDGLLPKAFGIVGCLGRERKRGKEEIEGGREVIDTYHVDPAQVMIIGCRLKERIL